MRGCECLHEPTDGVAGTANLIMIVCILPVISLLGIILNFINITVFSDQRGTAAKYLTALSCSDVGVCMAGIFVICSDSLRAHSFFVDQLFVFLLPKIIPLGLFFQMLSVYITVLAAFDCFVSVYRGTSVTTARGIWAPRVLAVIVIIVAFYNLVQFGDLQAIECLHPDNFTLYELCPTELRVSEAYVVVYKGYMYALSMAFIPFVLLSILTVGILSILRRNQDSEKSDCSEAQEQSSTTVLLLVIFLFLACNVTSLLVNIFEMFHITLPVSHEAILIDVGNFLVVINATANFFIYYLSSPEYKSDVQRRFRRTIGRLSKRKPIDLLHNHVEYV
ncbi:unnamed protein product [Auanema sp. JU1783]|nr:unnamed protein product [Auanema sp. JU1783]